MEEKTKTVAAVTILIGFVVVVLVVIGIVLSGKKVVSPVPPEGSIKIIFITPTMIPVATTSATPTKPSGR
jgi:ABC-type sugar transport system permease subunit